MAAKGGASFFTGERFHLTLVPLIRVELHYFSTERFSILVSQHTIFFSHSAVSNNFFSLLIHANNFFWQKKFMNFCTKGSFHALIKDHSLIF